MKIISHEPVRHRSLGAYGLQRRMPAGSSHSYQVLPDGPLVFALVLEAGIEIEEEL